MDYKDYTEEERKVLECADIIRKNHNSKKEVETIVATSEKDTENKRRMKFGKRILFTAVVICIAMLVFAAFMISAGKDTNSLNIMVTAGVSMLPIMFGIYEHNNTKINLKHMEENYIEDYDEKKNIY